MFLVIASVQTRRIERRRADALARGTLTCATGKARISVVGDEI